MNFQEGIRIKVPTGCVLKTLLCDVWKIPEDYVANRISTIFMDGKPVDDPNTAIIKDGSVLSLSAAMPGLVGAVMRRDGCLASFRSSITYREKGNIAEKGEGVITLKLFNLLISELGEHFQRLGIVG